MIDTILRTVGLLSVVATTSFAVGMAVMAWRERHKRIRLNSELGSVVDPFTSHETRLLVLRYRGVGHE